MTALQILDLGVPGGSHDFPAVVNLLDRLGVPWCLIGGVAVNAYCESILHTNDVDFVVMASELDFVCAELAGLGFALFTHRYWINARMPGSALVVQFTTDPRYQDFLARVEQRMIYDVPCRVAALPDLFQGKLWAATDPERRPIKQAKDELDLMRIADAHPQYLPLLPPALRELL